MSNMNGVITGALEAFCSTLIKEKILISGEEAHLVEKFMDDHNLGGYLPDPNWRSCCEADKPLKQEAEETNLPIKRYRDKEGRPTCASNFSTGEVCIFHRTQRMGINDTCVFANHGYKYHETMDRYGELGCLIPLNTCPVWPGFNPIIERS